MLRLAKWLPADRMDVAATTGVDSGRTADVARSSSAEPTDLERAETLRRQRQGRRSAFPDGALFQEPAWDLFLDLFICHERNQRVSLTGACDGACLAYTTGLRWLKEFERRGLVHCSGDATDGRRRLVQLAPDAVSAMKRYLATV